MARNMRRIDLSFWNKEGERKREEAQKGNSQKIAEPVKAKEENVTCFGNMMSIEPPLLLASQNKTVNLVPKYTPVVLIPKAT